MVGGSGYLGSHIAQRLRGEDCQVVTTHCTRPGPDSLFLDLTQPDSVTGAVVDSVQRLGGLDGVVVAAGATAAPYFFQRPSAADYDRLGPVSPEEWSRCHRINVEGTFCLCQAVAPYLKAGEVANLVLLGAIDGIKPVPAPIHFAASQGALKSMVEALAKELGHHQVCVNMLALGILEGGQSERVGAELKEAYLTHCSLKRFGKAAEVAEMVAWLVLENTYLTGQALLLDGGL